MTKRNQDHQSHERLVKGGFAAGGILSVIFTWSVLDDKLATQAELDSALNNLNRVETQVNSLNKELDTKIEKLGEGFKKDLDLRIEKTEEMIQSLIKDQSSKYDLLLNLKGVKINK